MFCKLKNLKLFIIILLNLKRLDFISFFHLCLALVLLMALIRNSVMICYIADDPDDHLLMTIS